jgi:hypothetical protein
MTERERRITYVTAILACILAAGEFFHGGEWMTESGIIHFIAVGFIAFAAHRVLAPRIASDNDFRPLARALTLSMAVFALTHAIEYLSGNVLPLAPHTEQVVIMNLYMAAFFAGVIGAVRMINATKTRLPIGGAISALIGLNLLIVILVLLPAVGYGFSATEGMEQASIMVFCAAFIFTMWVFKILAVRLRIIAPFVRDVMIAYAIVFVSVFPEPVVDVVGIGTIPEYRPELLSHYLFYLGMAVLYLSFDRLRMLGGIYAELEEQKA